MAACGNGSAKTDRLLSPAQWTALRLNRRLADGKPSVSCYGALVHRSPLRAYQVGWATSLPEPAVTKPKGRVPPAAMVLS